MVDWHPSPIAWLWATLITLPHPPIRPSGPKWGAEVTSCFRDSRELGTEPGVAQPGGLTGWQPADKHGAGAPVLEAGWPGPGEEVRFLRSLGQGPGMTPQPAPFCLLPASPPPRPTTDRTPRNWQGWWGRTAASETARVQQTSVLPLWAVPPLGPKSLPGISLS